MNKVIKFCEMLGEGVYEFYTTFTGKVVLYLYLLIMNLSTLFTEISARGKIMIYFSGFMILCAVELMNYIKTDIEKNNKKK